MRVLTTLLALLLLAVSGRAAAQDVADFVTVAPPADWVVSVKAPPRDTERAQGRDTVYALTDWQNRFGDKEHAYARSVVDLMTAAGVEENGTITIGFRPEHTDVVLHHVRIIRDGRTIDALDLSEGFVFRTETDRDKLIFSGAMTFAMPVLGLEVGDRLDAAYTLVTYNPAIGRMFNVVRSFGDGADELRLHYRVTVEGEEPAMVRYNDPPEPTITREPGRTVYLWDQPDYERTDFPGDVPNWAWTMDNVALSNAGSWADVGALFSADYVLTDADRRAVAPIVAEIAETHAGEAERTRAALDWVQRNIRYISVDIGASGFTPRRPERVLRRRFGDCKDVTLMLHAILDGLGVRSDPVLVDTDERGMQFEDQPYPYAFDHIIVAATVGGKLYPLDATRDQQLGTLDTMDRGDLRRGLRLRPGAEEIVELSPSDYAFRERAVETIDFTTKGDRNGYRIEVTEYGEAADGTVAWFAESGAERVTRDYVDFLADIYPGFQADGEAVLEVDHAAARTVLRVEGSFDRAENGKDRIRNRAFFVLNNMPDYEGGERRLPFSVGWPAKAEHVRNYVMDDTDGFKPGEVRYDTDSFSFEAEDTLEDGLFREVVRWEAKSDHIPAEQFAEQMADIRKARDVSYTTITYNHSGANASSTASTGGGMAAQLVPLLVLLLLGGGFFGWRYLSRAEVKPV